MPESKRSSIDKTEDVEKSSHVSQPTPEQLALEAKIMRRVDWRVLPLLAALWSIVVIDMINIPIARIGGMDEDLGLSIGDRYSIIACVFFIPGILLQVPSNLLLRPVGPRILLTIYIAAVGIIQLGIAFAPTWQIVAFGRTLIGVFEAGFFPALAFLITTWYKREELQKRLAIFALLPWIAASFSSILGYGIHLLKGRQGLSGWQWIFIIESIITLVLGIMCWFFMSGFPHDNTFLSKEETQVVLDRIERDRGDSLPDEITKAKIFSHLGDWTIWAYGLMNMSTTMAAFAIALFMNIILAGMGWGLVESFVLSAPPSVAAAIFGYGIAYISDKTKKRGMWILIPATVSLVGLFIGGYAKKNGVRYFGLCLVNIGSTSCIPAIWAFNSNNIVSHSKRSVASAVINIFASIGGLMATLVFRQRDFPRFFPGFWATIGCQLLLILLTTLLMFVYARRNKLAREGKMVLEGQPGFYYTL